MTTIAEQRYSSGAVVLHWLIATLIIINLALGLIAAGSEGDVHRWTLDLHKPIGIAILALSIARVAWRIGHRPPPVMAAPAWQNALATVTHAAFYFLIIAIPLTGWWFSSAVPERHPISFGLFDIPFLPTRQGLDVVGPIATTHGWLAYGMIALLALHVAAVAKHQFFDRDGLLRRMTIDLSGLARLGRRPTINEPIE